MRMPHHLFAALMAFGLLSAPAIAEETIAIPAQKWSFEGIFGTPDLASAQRGLQVYSEVCSACHSLRQLHYRDLGAIGPWNRVLDHQSGSRAGCRSVGRCIDA